MTIRKKILYSNILMLIIPVLIIASLGMIGVKKVGSRYWESLERMYEDGSGAVSVQSLIYSYQEGLKGIDWEQIEHEADSRVIVTDSGELKELQNELEDMGYHIRLYLDEIELYSNLTPGDEQTVEELMGERIWGMDALGDSATVMVHVNRIREKLKDPSDDREYIQTVWSAGYRFCAE